MSDATWVACSAGIGGLAADAQALLAQAEAGGSIYEGPDWLGLYMATVHDAQLAWPELWSLHRASPEAAQPRGDCCLVLPLRRRRASLLRGWHLESLANYYTGLYRPAQAHDAQAGDWRQLLQQALRGGPGQPTADRLVLQPLPADALPPLRDALAAAGMSWVEEVAFGNWHQDTRHGFDAYWRSRPGALRNTAERAQRRFAREGGRIDIIDGADPSDLLRACDDYLAVYAASWKPPEPHPDFMPALMRLAARRGWLRLGVARLNGRALAAHLWLVHAGRAEIFKLAYAEEASRWSAGTLLGRQLMEHVISRDGVHEVDYLIGDDDYKQLWMSSRRERWRVDAANLRTVRGRLLQLGRRLKGIPITARGT